MDKSIREFDRRHRAVTAKHRRLAEGYVTRLNPNGTIEQKPVRRVRVLPLKGLALAVTGFIAFKGYLLASLGPADYATHVAHLGSGSLFEQAGSWLMGADPASRWIAAQLLGFLS